MGRGRQWWYTPECICSGRESPPPVPLFNFTSVLPSPALDGSWGARTVTANLDQGLHEHWGGGSNTRRLRRWGAVFLGSKEGGDKGGSFSWKTFCAIQVFVSVI